MIGNDWLLADQLAMTPIPPSRAVGQLFGGIVLTALFYGSKTTEISR